MNEQEYKIIRNLAWDLLIDSKTSALPVNLQAIAALYGVECSRSKGLYRNALEISASILRLYGLSGKDKAQYLAVRVLAPIIVLDAIGVSSPKSISELTGLPLKLSTQRFNRLQELKKRGTIGFSRQERTVLSQFRYWINNLDSPTF